MTCQRRVRTGGPIGAGVALCAALCAALVTAAEETPPAAPGAPPQRLVVLPIESLVPVAAPLTEIRRGLVDRLGLRGVATLDDGRMEEILARHRLRYTGGVGREMAAAFREEARALLVVSVDLYDDGPPPRLGCIARLVSTDDPPRVLWAGGAARTGGDSPGLLGIGLELDPVVLRDDVLRKLADDVAAETGGQPSGDSRVRRDKPLPKLDPQRAFGALAAAETVRRVAVLPFDDRGAAPYAGTIVALQMVRALARRAPAETIEPGLVREALLEARLILEDGGPSLPQLALLRSLLDADLVVAGRVGEYLDLGGEWADPSVDLAVQAYDTRTGRVAWSSIGARRGAAGVVFFDLGRIHTAHALSEGMTDQLVRRMFAR